MPDQVARNAEEVAQRVLGLLAVIGLVHDRERAIEWIRENDIDQHMTDEEIAFMNANEPTHHDTVQFSWRAEAMVPLIWAIKGIDKMPALDEQYNVFDIPLIDLAMNDPRIFTSRVTLRSDDEIAEMEEFLYHQHWRVRDRDLGIHNDRPDPTDPPIESLDTGIVTERRYGMSWVAGDGESWDDVPTDT